MRRLWERYALAQLCATLANAGPAPDAYAAAYGALLKALPFPSSLGDLGQLWVDEIVPVLGALAEARRLARDTGGVQAYAVLLQALGGWG